MKPLVTVVPFSRDDAPRILNGAAVEKPAHVADFRRLQVLMEYGGIYLDTVRCDKPLIYWFIMSWGSVI